MAETIQAPRGTADLLPAETAKWQYVESVVRDTAKSFGFQEMRVPTFEYTELFKRGIGTETDVVQKEMYTFEDRGGRSVTLRPEGTASMVRAMLQHGLHNGPLPLKLYYILACFRGERPQAGRYREFHQFGVELFGAASPAADAEAISLPVALFDLLGIRGLRLEINSIGCPDCRREYHAALKAYFKDRADKLCDTCRSRLELNPMRILDCKSEPCKEVAKGAPVVLDFLCEDCRNHFEELKKRLEALGISYTVNPSIVRGLDYYTRTVFEFIDDALGLTVCGGGRYDGLVEQLGGPSLPAVGFGMGMERLISVMEAQKCAMPQAEGADLVYIASVGRDASLRAAGLARALREEGMDVEYDLAGKSVKAQMRYADKRGAGFTLVLGESELQSGTALLKNMRTGEQTPVSLADDALSDIAEAVRRNALSDLTDAVEKALGTLSAPGGQS